MHRTETLVQYSSKSSSSLLQLNLCQTQNRPLPFITKLRKTDTYFTSGQTLNQYLQIILSHLLFFVLFTVNATADDLAAMEVLQMLKDLSEHL